MKHTYCSCPLPCGQFCVSRVTCRLGNLVLNTRDTVEATRCADAILLFAEDCRHLLDDLTTWSLRDRFLWPLPIRVAVTATVQPSGPGAHTLLRSFCLMRLRWLGSSTTTIITRALDGKIPIIVHSCPKHRGVRQSSFARVSYSLRTRESGAPIS